MKAAIKSALDDMIDTKLALLLDTKVEPLRSSMIFISNGFDEMNKKIAGLQNTNAELAKENQFLRQENSRVSNALNQMNSAHDEQEQYIRRDCLDIRGVPTYSGEDTNEIVKKKSAPSLMFVLKIQISQYPTELKAIVRFLP